MEHDLSCCDLEAADLPCLPHTKLDPPGVGPVHGLQEVNALREEGLLQGGADYVSIIGNGDDWCVALRCMTQGCMARPWYSQPGMLLF